MLLQQVVAHHHHNQVPQYPHQVRYLTCTLRTEGKIHGCSCRRCHDGIRIDYRKNKKRKVFLFFQKI